MARLLTCTLIGVDTKHPIRKCIGRIFQALQEDKHIAAQISHTLSLVVDEYNKVERVSVLNEGITVLTAALDFPFIVKAVIENIDVIVKFTIQFLTDLVAFLWYAFKQHYHFHKLIVSSIKSCSY